jgi:hypothetical protein
MSSIMPMILEILADEAVMRSMAAVAWFITWPPSSARFAADSVRTEASSDLRALSATVAESCSIAAEVSSMVAACLVVRSARSLAPERISPVADFSVREVFRSWPTMSVSLSATAFVSSRRVAKTPR